MLAANSAPVWAGTSKAHPLEPLARRRLEVRRLRNLHELREDVRRRAGSRDEAEPGARGELGMAQFGERRHSGELAPARRAGGRDRVQLAALDVRERSLDLRYAERHMPAQQRLHLGPRTLERDVLHVEPEALVQLMPEKVRQRAGAERGIGDLARIRLDPGHQFAKRLRRHTRMRDQHEWRLDALDDPGEVGGLPAQIRIRARIDLDLRLRRNPQRIAVGGRPGHPLRGDIGIRPRAVLHDHRLAEQARHRLRHRARVHVRCAARRAAYQESDRLGGPRPAQTQPEGGAQR